MNIIIPRPKINIYNFYQWLLKKRGAVGIICMMINVATIVGVRLFFRKYIFEINKFFSENELEDFKKSAEDEIKSHHDKIDLRMYIASSLISRDLFLDYFHIMGIYDHHDMSTIILTSFHRYLNHKAIRLKQQIGHYKEYPGRSAFKRFKIKIGEKQINYYPKDQDVMDFWIPLGYITEKKDLQEKIPSFDGNIYVQVIKCFSSDTLGNVVSLYHARYDKVNNCIVFSMLNPADTCQIIKIFGITKTGPETIVFTNNSWGYQFQCSAIQENQKFQKIIFSHRHLKVENLPKVLSGPLLLFTAVPTRVLLAEQDDDMVTYSEGAGIGYLFTDIFESNNMFWIDYQYNLGLPRLDISSKEKYTVFQLVGPHHLPFYLRSNLFDTQDNIMLTFIKAAKLAEINGASAIDINMGCPSLSKYGGGPDLAENTELSCKIVKGIKDNIKIPVSVKIRFFSEKITHENEVKFIPDLDRTKKFVRIMSEAGADWIVIHTRIKEDYFRQGKAKEKWRYLKDIKDYLKISKINTPIFGNGEVCTPKDAEDLIKTTGCDGVMISSRVIIDPYILYRTLRYLKCQPIKEITVFDKIITATKDLYNHLLYSGTGYNDANFIIWKILKKHSYDILGSAFNDSEFEMSIREFSKKEMDKADLERTILGVLFDLAKSAVTSEQDMNKLEILISKLNDNTTSLQYIRQQIMNEYHGF